MKLRSLTTALPLLASCAHVPQMVGRVEGVDIKGTGYEDLVAIREKQAAEFAAQLAARDAAAEAVHNQYIGDLTDPVKEEVCSVLNTFDDSRQVSSFVSAGDGESASLHVFNSGTNWEPTMAANTIGEIAKNTLEQMANSYALKVLKQPNVPAPTFIPELKFHFPDQAFMSLPWKQRYEDYASYITDYSVFQGQAPYEYCESMVIRDIPGMRSEWEPQQMFVLTCAKGPGQWDSLATVYFDRPPQGLSLGFDTSTEWTAALGPDQRSLRLTTLYMMDGKDILRIGISSTQFKKDGVKSDVAFDAVRVDMAGQWPCSADKAYALNAGLALPAVMTLSEQIAEVYGKANTPRSFANAPFEFYGVPPVSYDLSIPLGDRH